MGCALLPRAAPGSSPSFWTEMQPDIIHRNKHSYDKVVIYKHVLFFIHFYSYLKNAANSMISNRSYPAE